jgi:hypothetical protein
LYEFLTRYSILFQRAGKTQKTNNKMKSNQKIAGMILLGIFSVFTHVQAQDMKMPADHIMIMPNEIK